MENLKRSLIVAVSGVLVLLVGCSTGLVSEVADSECDYTQDSYDHVYPRHCDPGRYTDKSKFNMSTTDYCNGLPQGQSLCRTVQSDPDRRTVQSDGRICYDKDMGVVVGTGSERWVRVVIEPDSGEVVTQFPETSAGCR